MRSARLLDRTIPAVGCGDVSLAIAASRGVDRRDAERALTAALELGLQLVDVHPAEDDAERLVGEVVRGLRLRDSAVTAITVPLRTGRDLLAERLPVAYLQHRVEAALRNTKLDALPLVQLPLRPAWLATSAWPEFVGTAQRLEREGKVLAWGARLDDADLPRDTRSEREKDEHGPIELITDSLRDLLSEPWFAALSLPYSLCAQTAAPLVELALAPIPHGPEAPLPVAAPASPILSLFDITAQPTPARKARRTRELAVFARQPLAGGALAGILAPGGKLPPRDDRTTLDDTTLERIAVAVARLAPLVRTRPPAATSTAAARSMLELQKPRDPLAMTLAELALRVVIDRGAIALPRLHRHEHVTDTLLALTAPPLDVTPERLFSMLGG